MEQKNEIENRLKDIIEEYDTHFYNDSPDTSEACVNKFPDVLEIARRSFNLGVQMSADNAKLKSKGKFVAAAGFSQYKTREVVDKQSILKLLIK